MCVTLVLPTKAATTWASHGMFYLAYMEVKVLSLAPRRWHVFPFQPPAASPRPRRSRRFRRFRRSWRCRRSYQCPGQPHDAFIGALITIFGARSLHWVARWGAKRQPRVFGGKACAA